MGIDVFYDFLDPSSEEPLDLDAVLDAVARQTEDDAYHAVHRKGHLALIGRGDAPTPAWDDTRWDDDR